MTDIQTSLPSSAHTAASGGAKNSHDKEADVTDLEKRLARRIRNQRVRLRQLEKFLMEQDRCRHWAVPMWRDYAMRLINADVNARKRSEKE